MFKSVTTATLILALLTPCFAKADYDSDLARRNAEIDILNAQRKKVETTNIAFWIGVAAFGPQQTAAMASLIGSNIFAAVTDYYYKDKYNKVHNPSNRTLVDDQHMAGTSVLAIGYVMFLVALNKAPLGAILIPLAATTATYLISPDPADKTLRATNDVYEKLKASVSSTDRAHMRVLAADASEYLAGAPASQELELAFEQWQRRALEQDSGLELSFLANVPRDEIAQGIVQINALLD